MENFEDVDPNLESDCDCLLCKRFREPKSWLRGKKRKTALQKMNLKEVKISEDQNSNQNLDEIHDPLSIEITTEEVSFVDFRKFFNKYYYLYINLSTYLFLTYFVLISRFFF